MLSYDMLLAFADKFIWLIKTVYRYLKNSRKLILYREFFIAYLDRVSAMKIPADKKYLARYSEFATGPCQRAFPEYATRFMTPHIENIAHAVFADAGSRQLYKTIFLRDMHASHFQTGWDRYYPSGREFGATLSRLTDQVSHPVKFHGNFFTSPVKARGGYLFRLKEGNEYVMPRNWFEVSVFLYRLGLNVIGKKYLNFIKKRDIIDAGAFIGDSSIVLSEYTTAKVYAVDPLEQNIRLTEKTLHLNPRIKNVRTVCTALGSRTGSAVMSGSGAGARLSHSGFRVRQTTLDRLVDRYKLKVGLVKMDVEGAEMDILLGSDRTIRRFTPVLLISIYHNGDQYVNIPSYMKRHYGARYSFRFIDCNPLQPVAEKVLVCLPKKRRVISG